MGTRNDARQGGGAKQIATERLGHGQLNGSVNGELVRKVALVTRSDLSGLPELRLATAALLMIWECGKRMPNSALQVEILVISYRFVKQMAQAKTTGFHYEYHAHAGHVHFTLHAIVFMLIHCQ